MHVLDPARFPFSPHRAYTPGAATVPMLLDMHASLGIERTVVAHNSVYADNACMLDALGRIGTERARGVGLVAPAAMSGELERLDRAGMRGARVNLAVARDDDPSLAARSLAVAERLPPHWHLHVNANLAVLASLHDRFAAMRTPVVLDHFAHARAGAGMDQEGLREVIALLRAGRAFVKLSAPYQVSAQAGYADVAPLARAYIEAAPTQVIWGSDWPHTGGAGRTADQDPHALEPFRPEDDAHNLDLLAAWAPDPVVRRRILVDNPGALYGFAPAP